MLFQFVIKPQTILKPHASGVPQYLCTTSPNYSNLACVIMTTSHEY